MTWLNNLIAESERDLVFMWHITSGSFFSTPLVAAPSSNEIENAISELVAVGAMVGFGDPDSSEFFVPRELLVSGRASASKIAELCRDAPENYKFLVFSVRSQLPNPALQRTASGVR